MKRKALGTNRPALGYESSGPLVRTVQTLGTKRPNLCVRIVQPGSETSCTHLQKGGILTAKNSLSGLFTTI